MCVAHIRYLTLRRQFTNERLYVVTDFHVKNDNYVRNKQPLCIPTNNDSESRTNGNTMAKTSAIHPLRTNAVKMIKNIAKLRQRVCERESKSGNGIHKIIATKI